MKKVMSIFIIGIALVGIGVWSVLSKVDVVDHNYLYAGETQDWTVTYKIEGSSTFTDKKGVTKYDGYADKVCRFTYKGDISELSSVKHLELTYKSPVSGGSVIEDYEEGEQPEKTYKLGAGGNGAIEQPNAIIKATINIDGKIETLELKNQK